MNYYENNQNNQNTNEQSFEQNDGFNGVDLSEFTRIQKKKKRGAILRLVIMAISVIIGIVAAYASIGETGFLKAFVNSSMGFIFAAVLWPIWKWVAFILPKSWSWAKGFWQSFVALNFFTLYIKFSIFVVILFLPVSIATGGVSALCFLMARVLMNLQDTFFNALWVTLLFVVIAVIFAWIDVCTAKGERFIDSVKSLFNK